MNLKKFKFDVKKIKPKQKKSVTSQLWEAVYARLGKRQFDVSNFFLSFADANTLHTKAASERTNMDWLAYSPATANEVEPGFIYYKPSEARRKKIIVK